MLTVTPHLYSHADAAAPSGRTLRSFPYSVFLQRFMEAYRYGADVAVRQESMGGSVEQCGLWFKQDQKNTKKNASRIWGEILSISAMDVLLNR